MNDDALGMGEELKEYDRVRVKQRLILSKDSDDARHCNDEFHRAMLFTNHPIHPVYGVAIPMNVAKPRFPPLNPALIAHDDYPACLHLLTLRAMMAPTPNNASLLLRVMGLDTKTTNTYNVASFVPHGFKMTNVSETTLTSVFNVSVLDDCQPWKFNGTEFNRYGNVTKTGLKLNSSCHAALGPQLKSVSLHPLEIRTLTFAPTPETPPAVDMSGVYIWTIVGAILMLGGTLCIILIQKARAAGKFKYVKMTTTAPEAELPTLTIQG